ncbi:MAG TPA: Rv2175c family DNA-binding protein [Nocardioidaceae bacterium]|nr:Rv2175c family DNA-binding protein [Nocardioidaceae bacterium]
MPEPDPARLEALVDGWLSVAEVAGRLGVSANRVRQLAREHALSLVRRAADPDPAVPAAFLDGSELLKGLAGTLTLLADHGFGPAESVEWLFTSDDSLVGRPIDALREDRGREVRRRAQVAD